MTEFGPQTTVDEVVALFKHRIAGKHVVITGASPGSLAYHFALAIAPHSPALLTILGRNSSNNEQTVSTLKSLHPTLRIRTITVDLISQVSVRGAAAQMLASPEPIDILLNSAGVSFGPYTLSPEGIERQFAINHIGHFLLTNLILPKILASSPGARIISVASRGHIYGQIKWDDINFSQAGDEYEPFQAYAQSKAANMLMTVSLAKSLKGRVATFSLHPGNIGTNFLRDIPVATSVKLGWTDEGGKVVDGVLRWSTPEQGAAGIARAALDPEIEDESGAYLSLCKVEKEDVGQFALDEANAERMWKLSEDLVSQKFKW